MPVLWSLLMGAAMANDISGVVRDADGGPVVAAWVVAYDQRLNYAYAQTTNDGSFRLVGLPANPYRLRVYPPMERNLSEQFEGGAVEVCDATVHDVRDGGAIDGVGFDLEVGAELLGVVVDDLGDPVPNVVVTAESAGASSSAQQRWAVSAEDGAFAVRGLPPQDGPDGTWRLRVEVTGWPRQYVGDTYAADTAETWRLSPGDAGEVGDVVLLPGVVVGGAVTGPDGPITSGTAHVYSPSQVVSVPIVDGRYEAGGLPPGQVLSWATVDGMAITYYPDRDRPGPRVGVLEEGAVYDDLDLEVASEARLVGRIRGDGQDLSGVTLLAYNDDRTVGIGDQCDADGSFAIGRLHGGRYTLVAYAEDEGFVSDFVRDQAGAEVVFDVPEGADSERYDIELPPGNAVTGVVTDRYTGEPIYGAYVYARSATDDSTRAVATGRDGTYELRGLVADTWELWVDYAPWCLGDPSWVRVLYEDEVNPELGGTVRLTGGDAVAWNPRMPPDLDQDGMDDVWEVENGLDPTVDDALEDPDGDGFRNLQEYWLGTDPQSVATVRRCACSDGNAALYGVLLVPLAFLRRRAFTNTLHS